MKTARFSIVLVAVLAVTLIAATQAPADGAGVASPIDFYADCEDGSIHYDYHNNTDAGVTVLWSRVKYPKSYGFDKNATLAYWDHYLPAGASFTHRISGIITVKEGSYIGVPSPGGEDTEPHRNGRYVAHWRLEDEARTQWTVRAVLRVECPNG